MNHDHIPTEEIKQDIADTRAEIHQMTREERGFRIAGKQGDRWSMMRADARVTGIAKRQEFITRLQLILNGRERKA